MLFSDTGEDSVCSLLSSPQETELFEFVHLCFGGVLEMAGHSVVLLWGEPNGLYLAI